MEQKNKLQYFIDLDERGEFRADVRRDGKTIFEIDGFEIFEDGFMNHKNDVEGLEDYLGHLGLLSIFDSHLERGN